MIIGIQMGYVSGCAVYENGKIIYAVSEERFNNRKGESGFPYRCIESAIQTCKITNEKIEKIVMCGLTLPPEELLCDMGAYSIEDYLNEQKLFWFPKLIEGKEIELFDVDYFREKAKQSNEKELYDRIKGSTDKKEIFKQWKVEKIAELFSVSEDKICFVNHEFAHAAYALYGSGKKENPLIIVYDGYGDESNASIYVYEDSCLKQIGRYTDFNVGRVYRYLTLLLGMKPNEHEYKVMGLAPYANEYIYKKPLEVFRQAYRFEEAKVITDPHMKDNYYYFKERLEGARFDGIAAALQVFTEEMATKLTKFWCEKTGKSICLLSGGVALNIKANMEIGKLDCVDDLFVVGSSGDESLSIGSIFYYLDQRQRGDEIEKLETLYLGDDIEESQVEKLVAGLDREKYLVEDFQVETAARKLAEGLIMGRADGKMEFGARALGDRSILADPSKRETIDKINRKVKNRDFWMPFTPSILAEDEDKYLVNEKDFEFPFMAVACETTRAGKEELKAAIHPADSTARPQLVTKEMNEKYYELLKEFKKLTGIGALLNTSLNIHGYPIARTAEDAFFVLENSDLDGLIFDNYIITRKR